MSKPTQEEIDAIITEAKIDTANNTRDHEPVKSVFGYAFTSENKAALDRIYLAVRDHKEWRLSDEGSDK